VEKYGRARQAKDGDMEHALCTWMSKTTDTHSEYEIIIALPLHQQLHESASMLRLYYIASLL